MELIMVVEVEEECLELLQIMHLAVLVVVEMETLVVEDMMQLTTLEVEVAEMAIQVLAQAVMVVMVLL